ncbi:MAG: DUF6714 family protein [Phycisphaerales bacterium JB039]
MKKAPDPGQIEKERERLLAHLESAFRNASRAGGVSWSEAGVMDSYGSEEDRAEARASDTDRRWMELVDDPEWDPEEGWGSACFHFLDPIGFRYYLAAWMMRILRRSSSGYGLIYHLTLPDDEQSRRSQVEQWSALDRKQRLFVTRFLRFKVAETEAQLAGFPMDSADWRRAVDSYWGMLD